MNNPAIVNQAIKNYAQNPNQKDATVILESFKPLIYRMVGLYSKLPDAEQEIQLLILQLASKWKGPFDGTGYIGKYLPLQLNNRVRNLKQDALFYSDEPERDNSNEL
jgi:hypothetical protein